LKIILPTKKTKKKTIADAVAFTDNIFSFDNYLKKDDEDEINKFKNIAIDFKRDLNLKKAKYVSPEQAHLQASFQFLSKPEQKIYKNFKELVAQKNNLQSVLEKFPPDSKADLQNQIADIDSSIKNILPDFQKIQQKIS